MPTSDSVMGLVFLSPALGKAGYGHPKKGACSPDNRTHSLQGTKDIYRLMGVACVSRMMVLAREFSSPSRSETANRCTCHFFFVAMLRLMDSSVARILPNSLAFCRKGRDPSHLASFSPFELDFWVVRILRILRILRGDFLPTERKEETLEGKTLDMTKRTTVPACDKAFVRRRTIS